MSKYEKEKKMVMNFLIPIFILLLILAIISFPNLICFLEIILGIWDAEVF